MRTVQSLIKNDGHVVGSNAIVGRLAPSPTGRLHLGHARSFLLAWWHARSRGGRIVLRLEDLDIDRVKPGMVEATLEDLRWLGLDWDDEPYLQSSGVADIEAAAEALLARGLAYPCACTRKEIVSAMAAPHSDETSPLYPGICRGKYPTLDAAERASGRPAALRFVAPEIIVQIEDGIQKIRTFAARTILGDFPILRRIGMPAYQLAVVVDDARQGVSEIVRGADLLESCARQWLLQEALGYSHPRWWHVPLVTDESGRRLAKRSDDVSLARLRAAGTDPRRIVSWAARSAAIEAPARVHAQEIVARFDMGRLPKSEVRLMRSDLKAFGLL
ncbi:MAG: tRNA glutamyl-Q(34) synthetase GluQRS [Candidatus Binatia bacterium]